MGTASNRKRQGQIQNTKIRGKIMRPFNRYKTSDKIPYSETGIEEFLEKELKQYQGKSFYCKALGVSVMVTARSIKEIAHNSRFNRQSAALALMLPYTISNAKVIELHLPVISNQQKRFQFQDIAKLLCNVPKYGIAKLTIGFKQNGEAYIYAITNYQNTKTNLFID